MKIKIASSADLAHYFNGARHLDAEAAADIARRLKGQWLRNEKINAVINKVNGKATRHTLNSHDLVGVMLRIETKFETDGIAKGLRQGRVEIRSPGPSASAYKYAAHGTSFIIERTSGGWFLTDCARIEVYPRAKGGWRFIGGLPAATREALVRSVERKYVEW